MQISTTKCLQSQGQALDNKVSKRREPSHHTPVKVHFLFKCFTVLSYTELFYIQSSPLATHLCLKPRRPDKCFTKQAYHQEKCITAAKGCEVRGAAMYRVHTLQQAAAFG